MVGGVRETPIRLRSLRSRASWFCRLCSLSVINLVSILSSSQAPVPAFHNCPLLTFRSLSHLHRLGLFGVVMIGTWAQTRQFHCHFLSVLGLHGPTCSLEMVYQP